MRYLNKIVLVTGARRGIGKLIANHFLNEGALVIGFNKQREDINGDTKYRPFQVNIAEPNSVSDAFNKIRNLYGRVDITINNAAVVNSQYSMIMPASAASDMLNINILGTFLVSREAAKLMRKNKWGRIINIGSMASSLEPIGDSVYAASKTAIITLANVMAKEFATYNITCNTLGISAISTDMLKQLPKDKIDKVVSELTLPRYAKPEDIINVVDFFASENSSYITAQTLFLGGVN